MQSRKSEKSSDGQGLVDGKVDEDHQKKMIINSTGNEGGSVVAPRRFIDLGLAANGEADETSLSSSEERRSESVKNGHGGGDHELEKKEVVNRGLIEREDSPDQSSRQGWGQNKVPKTMSSGSTKDADQTDATMRKARVSVRARSDAAMVGPHSFSVLNYYLYMFENSSVKYLN